MEREGQWADAGEEAADLVQKQPPPGCRGGGAASAASAACHPHPNRPRFTPFYSPIMFPPPQIYWDGLLVASAATGQTRSLQPGGALMLGAEQDCYGGCTDRRVGALLMGRSAAVVAP